jgi:hypothetical protein
MSFMMTAAASLLIWEALLTGKSKAVPVLKYCREDVWWKWRYICNVRDLGTSWRWVLSFTPSPLYPREKAHGTHWIGGWVGPRFGLAAAEKRRIFHSRDSNPGRPVRSSSLYRLSYPDTMSLLTDSSESQYTKSNAFTKKICRLCRCLKKPVCLSIMNPVNKVSKI